MPKEVGWVPASRTGLSLLVNPCREFTLDHSPAWVSRRGDATESQVCASGPVVGEDAVVALADK